MHVGDVGTELQIQLVTEEKRVLDLSTCLTKQIFLTRPDGTQLTKTANFVTDGKDGKISFLTNGTDLNKKGTYKIQAKVTFTGGTWYSSINTFTVEANLAV